MAASPPDRLAVAAVVLAAGASTRMGASKALLNWHGQPLLTYVIESITQAGYGPIVVILGHHASDALAAVPSRAGIHTVLNERYAEGRATSVIAAAEVLRELTPDAVLLASVDQPRSVGLLRAVRQAWEASTPPLAAPSLGGVAGHPVLFHGRLIEEMAGVSEERQGLRELVANHRSERLLVPVNDPLTLTNLNTLDGYQQALDAFRP